MRVIGLDIGATWIKSAVLNLDTGQVDSQHRTPFPALTNGACKAGEILDEVELHLQLWPPVPIFICCQTGGVVPVEIDEYGPIKQEEVFHHWSKCKVYRASPVSVYRSQLTGGHIPMSLGDWITYVLTGAQDRTSHQTNGGLSEIVKPVGCWQQQPVYRAIGDHACAVYGVDLQDDECSVNCGTGCQVTMNYHGWDEGQPPQKRYGLGGLLACVTHLPAGRTIAAGEIEPRAAAKWAAQAARSLRPFRKLKLSGGVCEAVDGAAGRSIYSEHRNAYNETVVAELGVAFEIIDDATFKGLLRLAKAVVK